MVLCQHFDSGQPSSFLFPCLLCYKGLLGTLRFYVIRIDATDLKPGVGEVVASKVL